MQQIIERLIPANHRNAQVLISRINEAPTFKMQQTVERFIPANHRNARVLISRINVASNQKSVPPRKQRKPKVDLTKVPNSYEEKMRERVQDAHANLSDQEVQQYIRNMWMAKTPEDRECYLEFEKNLKT